jgi:hypothetical protein
MTSSVKIGDWGDINAILAKRLGIELAENERFNNVLDEFSSQFPMARIVVTSKPGVHPMHPTETLYAAFDTIEAAAEFKLRYV